MLTRVKPSQDCDHCRAVGRDTSCGRAVVGDVEEKRRAGARAGGPAVVVDDCGVVVDGTGLTEVFSCRLVEQTTPHGTGLVGVVGGRVDIGYPPVIAGDVKPRLPRAGVGRSTKGLGEAEQTGRGPRGRFCRRRLKTGSGSGPLSVIELALRGRVCRCRVLDHIDVIMFARVMIMMVSAFSCRT